MYNRNEIDVYRTDKGAETDSISLETVAKYTGINTYLKKN